VPVFADVFSGGCAWFGEQRIGFGSSFDGARLDTTGTLTDLLLSDEDEQAV
jgi:hypothetical protein